MDSDLCRDLLNVARQNGAQDCVIVQTHAQHRIDEIENRQKSHRFERECSTFFYAFIDGAYTSAKLQFGDLPMPEKQMLQRIVADSVRACQISAAWHFADPIPNLKSAFESASAQNTENEALKYAYCTSFDIEETCKKKCLLPACLSDDDFNASPILDALSDDAWRIHPNLQIRLRQILTEKQSDLFFLDEEVHQKHFESRLFQSLCASNSQDENSDSHSSYIDLPPIAYDGIWFQPNIDLLEPFMTIRDIAAGLLRSALTTSNASNAPHNIKRVLLSPWVAAILLHETEHLSKNGKSIDFPVNFAFQYDEHLLLPPQRFQKCRGFTLVAPRSTKDFDAAKTSPSERRKHLLGALRERVFVVDAPTRFIRRRDAIVNMAFAIAATANSHGYEQHFQSLTLQFDLQKMWRTASLLPSETKIIDIPCNRGLTALKTGWIEVDGKLVNAL